MKTNEWLAYLLEQHREEFVERLAAELQGCGFAPLAGAISTLAADLDLSFTSDDFTAVATTLSALAGQLGSQDHARAPQALEQIWQKVEQLLGGYLAEEDEISAGARRLAYLRLGELGRQARELLAS